MGRHEGWACYRHATIGSTNDEARRLVSEDDPAAPFVVWADRQTKGRGRGSNAWFSDGGSLLVTLGIDPRAEGLSPAREPKVALVAAMACISAFEPFCDRTFSIRWPNDVEVDGRKIAGCLVERVESHDGPRLLVGIGINVATRFDGATPDVRRLAVSLAELSPRRMEPASARRWSYHVLLRLLERFRHHLGLLDRMEEAFDAFVNRHDGLKNRRVTVRQGENLIEGTGRGINADGSLALETDAGLVAIYGGQVLRD